MMSNIKGGKTGDQPRDKKLFSRRKFMTTGALGSAGLLVGCDCAERLQSVETPDAALARSNIKPRELKMVTTWPKNFPGLGQAAENLARFITEMSGGAMRVKLYAAGELVGAFDVFDAVSSGAADIYHAAEYYWTGRNQAYSFFTAVPFGMTASEIMGWTEFGGGQQLWDELAAGYNLKPFAAGNTGHQMGGWFRKELNSVEDLRGLKMRIPGMAGEVLRRAGGSPVTMPGSEFYQYLQLGAIDAIEWVGPWNDVAFGFYREAQFYYWPGFHEPGAQLGAGFNLDLWNDMSLQEKSIIENACRATNHLAIAQYAHYNGVSLKTLTEKYGVKLRQMPEDIMALFAEKTVEVLREIGDGDDLSKRIFESYRTALNEGIEWNAISDQAFLDMRSRLFRTL